MNDCITYGNLRLLNTFLFNGGVVVFLVSLESILIGLLTKSDIDERHI